MRSLTIILLIAGMLGWSSGTVPAAPDRTVSVGPRDNHSQVHLRIGDLLVVRLPARAGSGLQWQVIGSDPSILRPVGQPTFVLDRGGAPGAGRHVFQFRAVSGGGVGLTLVYQHLTRRGLRPADRFEILVLVRGAGPRETVTVTDSQNHGSVMLRPGDILQVRLISNPSTGFAWRVARNDRTVLQPIGEAQLVRAVDAMPGAPGHQLFRFRAAGPGRLFLRLSYDRPVPQGDVAPRYWEILVTVRR